MYLPGRHESVEPDGYRYGFQGQELDNEVKGEGNSYNYTFRMHDPRLGRFFAVDPLFGEAPEKAPYHFLSNSPLNRIDADGRWDIEVHAFKDRKKNGYALFIVKDNMGNEVYRTVARTIGTGGRIRNVINSDTPQGQYKILGWRKTDNARYSRVSFGPNDLLALDYQGEEGGSRNGMHAHGGRQEGKYLGRMSLADTHGCMRINDDDIAQIKKITDALEENDKTEKPGTLSLADDLNIPIKYSNKRHLEGLEQFPIKKKKDENARQSQTFTPDSDSELQFLLQSEFLKSVNPKFWLERIKQLNQLKPNNNEKQND